MTAIFVRVAPLWGVRGYKKILLNTGFGVPRTEARGQADRMPHIRSFGSRFHKGGMKPGQY